MQNIFSKLQDTSNCIQNLHSILTYQTLAIKAILRTK